MFIITPSENHTSLPHKLHHPSPLSTANFTFKKKCPFFFRPETLVLAKRCKIANQIIDKFKL
jgi:hypothetical protein